MLPIIHLRERELTRALCALAPSDLVVLMKLVLLADSGTGIAHVLPDDLANELVLDPHFIPRALERLADREFLERLVYEGDVGLVEVGPLLVRRGAAPANLPVHEPV